jgi:hypothetical protein
VVDVEQAVDQVGRLPGTALGGIRSTTVNERWIRANRLGSRTARAHNVFAPRCSRTVATLSRALGTDHPATAAASHGQRAELDVEPPAT